MLQEIVENVLSQKVMQERQVIEIYSLESSYDGPYVKMLQFTKINVEGMLRMEILNRQKR